MSLRPALLAAMLFLTVPALAQDYDDYQLEARRFDIMVDQSETALHVIASGWRAAPPADYGDGDDDAYGMLLRATHRFNTTVERACRANLADAKFCGAPYAPPWLKNKPADLRGAFDDAAGRIIPFWEEVCTRARAKTPDASPCVME